jgi:hypothetical protein
MFSGLTGRRCLDDYDWFKRVFPAFETLNGAMLESANRRAAELAATLGKAAVGGSDSHSMRGVGRTYTFVPGTSSKHDFLAGLRQGHGLVRGESGSCSKLTADVLTICAGMLRERAWTWLVSPLIAGVPAVILVNYILETKFAEHWFRRANRMLVNGVGQLSPSLESRAA